VGRARAGSRCAARQALRRRPAATSKALIHKLRKQLDGGSRRKKAAEERGYKRAVAELKAQAEREQQLNDLGIPRPIRALLDGVDLGDEAAVNAKIAELREGGVSWGQQPVQASAQAGSPTRA
jgi:hypothetical protein